MMYCLWPVAPVEHLRLGSQPAKILCAPALLPCCHFAETMSKSTFAGRGASSGVGFAIPIDTVSGLVDQILKFGRVVRPVRVATDW